MSDGSRIDERERALAGLLRLKIFPLPGAVLLPGSAVPLHVFEPRYRKMVRDCQAGDRVLALAQIAPQASPQTGAPRLLPVLGVGVLERVEPLADGRFNILLKGVLRARILAEPTSAEVYRVVQAEPLLDDPKEAARADVLRAAEDLRRMLLALVSARPEADADGLTHAAREREPGALADLAAGVLLESPHERQNVLEALYLAKRLDLVAAAAATQLARTLPRQSQSKLLN